MRANGVRKADLGRRIGWQKSQVETASSASGTPPASIKSKPRSTPSISASPSASNTRKRVRELTAPAEGSAPSSATRENGPSAVGSGISQPVAIYHPDPEYTREARNAKYQGTVILSVVVDKKGHAKDIGVVKPLGMGLDKKAIEAVKRWRWRPGTKGGRPVDVPARITLNFRLL